MVLLFSGNTVTIRVRILSLHLQRTQEYHLSHTQRGGWLTNFPSLNRLTIDHVVK